MYSIENLKNKILCGDSAIIMKDFPDECIDLVISSPPYDKLRSYKKYEFDFEKIANELYRILKKGGVIVWIVGDETKNGSESGTSFEQALYFKKIGLNLHDTMIYEKNGASYPSNDNSIRYTQIFEYMFILSKGIPKTHNLIRDKKNRWGGYENFGKITKRHKNGELIIKNKKFMISEFGIRNNIWRYSTGNNQSTKDKIAYQHPAIFPEQLANDHIITWSNEGDIVLDSLCGSGTALKMAKLNKRIYIGIDISEEYVKISEKRVNIFEKEKLDIMENSIKKYDKGKRVILKKLI